MFELKLSDNLPNGLSNNVDHQVTQQQPQQQQPQQLQPQQQQQQHLLQQQHQEQQQQQQQQQQQNGSVSNISEQQMPQQSLPTQLLQQPQPQQQQQQQFLPSPISPKPNLQLQLQQELKPQHEPVNRGEPVEKLQAPDTAKTMRQLFESGKISDSHNVIKTVPDVNLEFQTPGSGVFENEPIRLEGVIRSDDVIMPEEELQGSSTRIKLDDYLEKSRNQFVITRGPVTLAEDEGKVLENAPVVRTDVIREQDQLEEETILPHEGQTKALKQQWLTMNHEFVKENKPIKLVEREGEKSIVENQPEVRTDVLREEDPTADESELLRRGLTSNLKSYWTNYEDRGIYARDKPVVIPGSDGKTSSVSENNPVILDNVTREQDLSKYEVDNIERGRAKSLVGKWLSMEDTFRPKEFFNMETELACSRNAGVFENKPEVVRDDVIKSGEMMPDIMTKEGVAKYMSERFKDSEFWNPKSPKSPPVLELAEGPGVHENVPATLHPDVVRCDVDSDQMSMSSLPQGITADLVGRWKRQDVVGADLNMPDKSYFNEPSKLLQQERASDSGVYENKPEVRTDVYREEDMEPEMVSASKTRSLRSLWSKMGEEEPKKTGMPKQIRFTPPRDKSPPSLTSPQEDYKSVHQVNFSNC